MDKTTPIDRPVGRGNDGSSSLRSDKFYTMARRSEHIVPWSDLKPTIETGDIVLFSGQSVVSKFIQMGQGGTDWSHIGMFVRPTAERRGDEDRVLLLESTTYDGLREVIGGEKRGGVRLVDAEESIRHYLQYDDTTKIITRQIYVDRSMIEHGVVDPASRADDLWAFITRVSGLPYEENPYELARAMHRGLEFFTRQRTESSYFCSELVAEAYMVLGLLPNSRLEKNNQIQQEIIQNQRKRSRGGFLSGFNQIIPQMKRNPSGYTPLDFSQEGENLPFLYNRKTKTNMVGLGPHIDIAFVDRDPTKFVPEAMVRPVRPRVRVTMS